MIDQRNEFPSERPPSDSRERSVIFDLDGTLIDSEFNYLESDRLFLARYGVEWTEELWRRFVGIGSRSMLQWMRGETGIEASVEQLLEEKNLAYLDVARRNTRVFPEMVELVKLLRNGGFSLAIATGSSSEVLHEVLDITGLRGLFEVVVSADEVAAGKPAPDVFLEAARRLGTEPGDCIVVEDSQYGVEAAASAGMSCVAVPTVVAEPLPECFERAGLLYRGGMGEFDPEEAFRWICDRDAEPVGR